jgi:hypothetical protein
MKHHELQTTPLPSAFIGLCSGGLVGIAISSIWGIDQEINRGETDLEEILQWGIIGGMLFGFVPGLSLEHY